MANIQHRDIPDEGRHELKGASTAIVGSVPISNGIGGTTFQRLGVASLTGSIPTGVADVQVVTDGLGGFKAASAVYACIQRTTTGGAFGVPLLITLTDLITPQGVFINGTNFQVQSTGAYQIILNSLLLVTSGDPPTTTPSPEYTPINLYRRDLGTSVGVGGSIIVNLISGIDYGVNQDATITVVKL